MSAHKQEERASLFASNRLLQLLCNVKIISRQGDIQTEVNNHSLVFHFVKTEFVFHLLCTVKVTVAIDNTNKTG